MSVVSLAPSVSATSDEELLKKTLLNLLPICYSQHMANSVENASAFFPQNVADSTQAYLVPTNVGNSLNNQKISCQEVFDGVSGWGGLTTKMNGLLDLYGKGGGPFNPEDFGYKPSAGATTTNRKCVYLTYTYNDPNSDYDYPDQKTNSVCFPVASDGKVSIENPFNDIKCISPEGNEETMSECGSTITESGRIKLYYDSSMESLQTYMNDARAGTYTTWVASLYNKTYSQVWSELQSNAPDVTGGVNFEEQSVSNVSAHEDNSGSGGSTSTSYAKESLADQTALKYFTGSDSYTNVYFTDNDWASLYMAYFQQVKDKYGLRLDASSCSSSKDGVANAITTDGGQTWCSISNISDVPDSEKFAGRARRGDNRLSERTFAQIVADFGTLDFSKVDNSTLGNLGLNTGGDSSSGSTSENAATPNCFNSAGSLGWILCPVLEGLSTVVDGIYDNIIVPQFLEIDASFMAADSSGSVYKGWTDFRNYANILFAILFIVVIFAQVTGIGISNYNVKKILPRLIMTVVLVNISFILCQLAVDLSNILGFSLKKLFVDMAGETVVTVGGFVGNIGSALVSTTVTGGVIVGAVTAAVITWEFWLFPLLLFLLGIIISVFFFAIILGVRKAGILILIVLAPVAIVCYTLPNTKRFFDRWLKMFSSLILVYPICGLLMGGGQYASTLLIGAASGDDVGFFMALVAMLVQVVPFFFIPSLVKGSLAAMGNLGMKISNMGSRFSGGIQRGIRGTEGYREAERSLNMRNAQKTFNRLNRKIEKARAANKDPKPSLMRRRSNAAARYNRMAFEDIRAGGTQELMSPGSAQRTLAEQNARSRQMKEDVSAQESIYKNNPELADDQIMGNVYEDALDELMADPTSREAEVKVQALQNILSETDAGRSQVQNRMMSVLAKNASTMATGQMNGTETGLSKAAAHLSREHMATYKAKNRGMYSLIGDLSRQQYDMGTQEMRDAHGNVITDPTTGQARRHALRRIVSGTDSQGKDVFEYRSDHYDKSGLSSYTAETLAGADEGTIDRIMEGIGSGNINDADLQTISTTASEALNSDTVRVQPKIAKKLRQIERAGYAASPSSFARASDASLGDIVGRIQAGEINNANGSTELTRLALSAQSALRDPSALHSQATAERLNQILTAAGAQGAVDAATGSHFKAVDASTIKVRGGRQKVAMPTGWARGADGKWYEGGQIAGRQLNATEVKKAEQIEAHNNQVDIDNGTI